MSEVPEKCANYTYPTYLTSPTEEHSDSPPIPTSVTSTRGHGTVGGLAERMREIAEMALYDGRVDQPVPGYEELHELADAVAHLEAELARATGEVSRLSEQACKHVEAGELLLIEELRAALAAERERVAKLQDRLNHRRPPSDPALLRIHVQAQQRTHKRAWRLVLWLIDAYDRQTLQFNAAIRERDNETARAEAEREKREAAERRLDAVNGEFLDIIGQPPRGEWDDRLRVALQPRLDEADASWVVEMFRAGLSGDTGGGE